MYVWTVSLGIQMCLCFFFFFFQAEDGIRDVAVTGVQTCALPISRSPRRTAPAREPEHSGHDQQRGHADDVAPLRRVLGGSARVHDLGWRAVLGPDRDQRLRSEEHTSELQSRLHLVCRLLLEKKKKSD